MDPIEFKKALDIAEMMGFDRGARTIFVEILKAMEEDKMLAISYLSLKKLYDRYSSEADIINQKINKI